MSKINKIKESLQDALDKIKDSDAFHELKNRYDELDANVKLYLNIAAVVSLAGLLITTVYSGVSKANDMKSDIEARGDMIHYLQESADRIQRLKMQRESQNITADTSAPLPEFVQNIGNTLGLNSERMKVGEEKTGQSLKDAQEVSVDALLTQTNIKTLTRFLYTLTDQGSARSLTIADLTIDTKNDPDGYIDATLSIVAYKPK